MRRTLAAAGSRPHEESEEVCTQSAGEGGQRTLHPRGHRCEEGKGSRLVVLDRGIRLKRGVSYVLTYEVVIGESGCEGVRFGVLFSLPRCIEQPCHVPLLKGQSFRSLRVIAPVVEDRVSGEGRICRTGVELCTGRKDVKEAAACVVGCSRDTFMLSRTTPELLFAVTIYSLPPVRFKNISPDGVSIK